MTLDVRQTGEAIFAASGDLARAWRSARLAGGEVFPGVLDGVMEAFLAQVGEALAAGTAPELAWAGASGVVRVMDGERALPLLAAEWRLAGEVLLAACDALAAGPEAVEAIRRAVDAAAAAGPALLGGEVPDGVLPLRQLGGFRPRGAPRSGGPR